MADTFKFEIVTPEGLVHSQNALMVTLPATEGQIGILPHHVPLMTELVPGAIIVHTGTGDKFLDVGEGLIEVGSDHVTVLTDMAMPVEGIDEPRGEDAPAAAPARLREKLSDEDIGSVNAPLTRSLAQLTVKRRHRR